MDAGIEVQGASEGTATPIAVIDPTGQGQGAAEVAALTAQEDAVLAVSGGVIAADVGTPAEAMLPGTRLRWSLTPRWRNTTALMYV